MIDMTIQECDKLSKYKDIQIETERMPHLKARIVPVVDRALGNVDKNTLKRWKTYCRR